MVLMMVSLVYLHIIKQFQYIKVIIGGEQGFEQH